MKKTNSKNNQLSPEQYIRQKVRGLEIGKCYMNRNWNVTGKAIAIITRMHKHGTVSAGIYFIDTFCLGIRESTYYFSIQKEEFENLLNNLRHGLNIPVEECTYQEVHNLIYGVIEFAEEGGITPSPSYNTTQYFLEEDTEDIPLIRYWYGKEGKHLLVANNTQELDKFMPYLLAHLGADNVFFTAVNANKIYKGYEYIDAKTAKNLNSLFSKIVKPKNIELEKYTYADHKYPKRLRLKNKEVYSIISNPENACYLNEDTVKKILELPHDELKDDLEKILLYETGLTYESTNQEAEEKDTKVDKKEPNTAIIHSVILLGELGYESSLPTILKVLCQNSQYYNTHFGYLLNDIMVPTIYMLGKNQLEKLMDFMKTPGLYTYAKYLVVPAVSLIAKREPERRDEVICWFKELLEFYKEKLKDNICCDGTLIGLISVDIKRLKAVELLPLLKDLFETGLVDEQCCGSYERIESSINKDDGYDINYAFDINDRYKPYKKD